LLARLQEQRSHSPPYGVTSAATRSSTVMPYSAYRQPSYSSHGYRHGIETH
jgi:hypothetical protein